MVIHKEGEIQLREMGGEGFSTGPPPRWNGFSVATEDNELYSISLRGRPAAAWVATLVHLGGLAGTGCSRESERGRPAVVRRGALRDLATGNTRATALLTVP